MACNALKARDELELAFMLVKALPCKLQRTKQPEINTY